MHYNPQHLSTTQVTRFKSNDIMTHRLTSKTLTALAARARLFASRCAADPLLKAAATWVDGSDHVHNTSGACVGMCALHVAIEVWPSP